MAAIDSRSWVVAVAYQRDVLVVGVIASCRARSIAPLGDLASSALDSRPAYLLHVRSESRGFTCVRLSTLSRVGTRIACRKRCYVPAIDAVAARYRLPARRAIGCRAGARASLLVAPDGRVGLSTGEFPHPRTPSTPASASGASPCIIPTNSRESKLRRPVPAGYGHGAAVPAGYLRWLHQRVRVTGEVLERRGSRTEVCVVRA